MALKFGKDGTLYCGTVKYNYKQARNLIADGSCGNLSGIWTNYVKSENPAGYKSFRCFAVSNSNTTTQKIGTLYAGRKYYFSCRVMTGTVSVAAIVLRNGGADIPNSNIFPGNTNGAWVLASTVVTMPETVVNPAGDVCIWVTKDQGVIVASRFILVDLTETFGAGNEPSKEWCDQNIREQEVFVNFGCVSDYITKSNWSDKYAGSELSATFCNYLKYDSYWEPWEYFVYITGKAANPEGFIYDKVTKELDKTLKYYMYWESQHNKTDVLQSCDFYFPEAEPSIGSVDLVDETVFNGGGGMTGWKRTSGFNSRTTFANGKHKIRFDYNNFKKTNEFRVTALNVHRTDNIIAQYNVYNGTNISVNDINKEWCDRWIDGRSSPIIHIKDPKKTSIKFSLPNNYGVPMVGEYDIVCNDIEIRPETNKITMDKTGTIKCKRLVKSYKF